MEKADKPRVRILQSKMIELAGFLYVLADPDTHEQVKEQAHKVRKMLWDEFSGILTILAGLQFQGLEIVAFLLDFKIYNDLLDFEHSVQRLDHLRFFSLFLGVETTPEIVEKSLKNPDKALVFFKKHSWVSTRPDTLEKMFKAPDKFRGDLFSVLKNLNTEEFNLSLKQNTRLFQDALSFLNGKLNETAPLDFAQELMKKTFKRISNYREFIFVPSFYFNKRAVRFMDEDTLILIHPILRRSSYEEDQKKIITALKSISDPTRFEILRLLLETPLYGKQIADRLNLSAPTISHHLEQLKSAGLISEERVKNLKYFSSNPSHINDFLSHLGRHLLE